MQGTARLVYSEFAAGRIRCGLAYENPSEALRANLIREVFADPNTWAQAHVHRVTGYWQILFAFFAALFGYFRPFRTRQRRDIRRARFRRLILECEGSRRLAWTRDISSEGFSAIVAGRPPQTGLHTMRARGSKDLAVPVQAVYAHRYLPGLWRIGFRVAHPPQGIA